jgi:hypothetical protein
MTKTKFILMEHQINKKKHYDIRIKVKKNKWISFAVVKGIPLENKKSLMIRTKNHSETSALFTGKTKTGRIIKIDSGGCEILKYNKKHIVINFYGSQLKGVYHFVYVLGKENHYLIFRGNYNETN